MPIQHTPGGAKPVPGATGKYPEYPVEDLPKKYPQTEEEWLERSQGNQSCNILQCQRCEGKFNYLGFPEGRRGEVLQVINQPAILCGICLQEANPQEIAEILRRSTSVRISDLEVKMTKVKVQVSFMDWRERGRSIYSIEKGVDLSMGVFHSSSTFSGSTFDAEIELDESNAEELIEAMQNGHHPCWQMSLPEEKDAHP